MCVCKRERDEEKKLKVSKWRLTDQLVLKQVKQSHHHNVTLVVITSNEGAG